MNEQTTPNEQAVAPASPVTEETSLADYRAWRDKPAAERPETANVATEQADTTEDHSEGETTEDSDPSETNEQGTEAKPGKKKGGFQRTIDKLKSELDELKGKLAGQPAEKPAEAAAPAAPAAPAVQAPQFAEAEPQLEDFENIAEYTKALLKWDRARTNFEQARAQAQRQQAEKQKTVIEAWKQRETEAKTKHADYDAALAAVSEVKIPTPHQHALVESEHGPEVAYYLAKNPEELKQFVTLSPLAAARAIGKIEASLASERASTTAHKSKVSSAPAPIRTVAGKAVGTFDVKNSSLAEYRQAREQGRVR